MNRYLNKALRRLVQTRAASLCEYCLLSERDAHYGHQVDHIISLKHGGGNEADNLAYVCAWCNRYKGSDVGSIHWPSRQFVRFFNPRLDRWTDHFRLEGALIQPLTEIGAVTARLLNLNHSDRLEERQLLIDADKYPAPAAKSRLNN